MLEKILRKMFSVVRRHTAPTDTIITSDTHKLQIMYFLMMRRKACRISLIKITRYIHDTTAELQLYIGVGFTHNTTKNGISFSWGKKNHSKQ